MPLAAVASPASSPAAVETDEIGLYQVGNGDLAALAHVGPVNAPEFADTVSTEDVLRPAAEATGGSVRRIAGADRRRRCPASCRCAAAPTRRAATGSACSTTDDSVLKSVSRVPLFGGFLGLGVLLLALGSMWYREGR